jgi:hypothetical protein
MNPEKFREQAHAQDEYERKREWCALHGEGESEITLLRRENGELKGQLLMKQGAIDYLEKNKIPWLEGEIARLRQEIWRR